MNYLFLFLSLALICCRPVATKSDGEISQSLLRTEQQLMEAIAIGDTMLWENHLHDSCLIAVENGETMGKAKLISTMKPLPEGYEGKIHVIESQVQLHGSTAVVSFIADEFLTLYGQKIHTQYRQTDTWQNFNGEWKIIAMQVFEVPKNPPPVNIGGNILRNYEGEYTLGADRKCNIKVKEGKLFAEKSGRDEEELFAETDNVFFRRGDGRVRVIFLKNGDDGEYRMHERRAGEDLVWTKTKP